jgi:hypothetical protein
MIVLMVEKQDCLVNNSSYQNSRIIGFELLDDPPKQ